MPAATFSSLDSNAGCIELAGRHRRIAAHPLFARVKSSRFLWIAAQLGSAHRFQHRIDSKSRAALAASAQGGHLSLVGFGAPNWPRPDQLRVTTSLGGTETIRASNSSRDRLCLAACGRGTNAAAAVPQWPARTRRRALIWLLASAIAALGSDDVFSASRLQHVPAHRFKAAETRHHKHTSTQHAKRQARVRDGGARVHHNERPPRGACDRTEHPPAD